MRAVGEARLYAYSQRVSNRAKNDTCHTPGRQVHGTLLAPFLTELASLPVFRRRRVMGWSVVFALGMAAASWAHTPTPVPPKPTTELRALGREVFRTNCQICHGIKGDGNGFMAYMLDPKPRNFTRGVFRFKSTETGSLPTTRNMYRTISIGVGGTGMPAWESRLTELERWAVIYYVKTFSKKFSEGAPGSSVVLGVEPAVTRQMIAKGKENYAKFGCRQCHGDTGHGDGPSSIGMKDSFGFPIRPRNYHQEEQFKRGRTMRDVALTIATGNDGTPMPSFNAALTREDIWALASYVISMKIEPPAPPRNMCGMMRPMKGM
jgi:cytochrome c oxidase cbb3-type subunit 2